MEAAEKRTGFGRTPIKERAQVFYRYKALLEKNIPDSVTRHPENGKVRGRPAEC